MEKARGEAGAWGRLHRDGYSDMRRTLWLSAGSLNPRAPSTGTQLHGVLVGLEEERILALGQGLRAPITEPWGSVVQGFFFYWTVPVTGPSSGSPGQRTHPVYSLRMTWNQPANRSTGQGVIPAAYRMYSPGQVTSPLRLNLIRMGKRSLALLGSWQ